MNASSQGNKISLNCAERGQQHKHQKQQRLRKQQTLTVYLTPEIKLCDPH